MWASAESGPRPPPLIAFREEMERRLYASLRAQTAPMLTRPRAVYDTALSELSTRGTDAGSARKRGVVGCRT